MMMIMMMMMMMMMIMGQKSELILTCCSRDARQLEQHGMSNRLFGDQVAARSFGRGRTRPLRLWMALAHHPWAFGTEAPPWTPHQDFNLP